MENISILKEKLLQEIGKLPGDKLREVLDFARFLLTKEQAAPSNEPGKNLDPARDPILNFIGGVSHGSLSRDIDREIYGE